MTTVHTITSNINLILRDAVPNDTRSFLTVERAWLPMLIWDNVQVTTQTEQDLTFMERFVVECLLTLGQCQAEELLEIASVPPELAGRLLSCLTQKGLAHRDGKWFSPVKKDCQSALAQQCIMIKQEARRSFLWFPETQEIVIIPGTSGLIGQLRHIHPLGTFPLPSEMEGATRGQIIRDAKANGRLYGDDAGSLLDISDNEPLHHGNCPAYYCRAKLPQEIAGRWQVAITGYRKRKPNNESGKENTYPSISEEIELPIPVLPDLYRSWRDRLESVGGAIKNVLEQRLGKFNVSIEGCLITADITAEGTRRIRRDRLLANCFGVRVSVDGVIDYAMSMQLRPPSADPAAQRLFALDDTVREILAAPNTSEAAQMICARRGHQVSEIIERLWDLKLFHKVYELREREDFS